MLQDWSARRGRGVFKIAENSKPCIIEITNWKFVTQEIETYSETCQGSGVEVKRK